jgi:hypothetical protein
MRIESGSTRDQQVRDAIFLIMFVGMSAWFGIDGWVRYPAKNLEWAAQKLPVQPPGLRADPLAVKRNLSQITDGTEMARIKQLLGEPSLDLPRELKYVGREVTAAVSFDEQGRVAAVKTAVTEAAVPEAQRQVNVTRSRIDLVKEGMSESQVTDLLGQGGFVRDRTLWYIGPAAYGEFRIVAGRVSGKPEIQFEDHRSEWSILLQKLLAVVVGLIGLYGAVRLWRTLRMHVVVDETGLTCCGTHVPWGAMTRLRTDEYKDKGWADLDYLDGGQERSLRLDSYLIRGFNPIVTAICDRKSFPSPLAPPPPGQADRPS